MECVTCNKNEHKYDYQLRVGDVVPLCEECGKILYGIKPIYNDRLLELVRMKECVLFYKRMIEAKQKVLKKNK